MIDLAQQRFEGLLGDHKVGQHSPNSFSIVS